MKHGQRCPNADRALAGNGSVERQVFPCSVLFPERADKVPGKETFQPMSFHKGAPRTFEPAC